MKKNIIILLVLAFCSCSSPSIVGKYNARVIQTNLSKAAIGDYAAMSKIAGIKCIYEFKKDGVFIADCGSLSDSCFYTFDGKILTSQNQTMQVFFTKNEIVIEYSPQFSIGLTKIE